MSWPKLRVLGSQSQFRPDLRVPCPHLRCAQELHRGAEAPEPLSRTDPQLWVMHVLREACLGQPLPCPLPQALLARLFSPRALRGALLAAAAPSARAGASAAASRYPLNFPSELSGLTLIESLRSNIIYLALKLHSLFSCE